MRRARWRCWIARVCSRLSLIVSTRTRRDHAKYLTLIDAIALLHQHQREIKTLERAGKRIEYIEVTQSDIALANTLAHDVLGRSLDELPPQTRRVLARTDVRFTRRELRAACGMSDAAIRVHLNRLITMEYVRTVAGRNGLRFEYELLFDGDLDRSAPQMVGLIDAQSLAATTVTLQGREADLAPRLHVARTDPASTLQSVESAANALSEATSADASAEAARKVPLPLVALDGRSAGRSSAPPSSSLAASSSSGS